MTISYDAAIQIAQEMVKRGEVVPHIDPSGDDMIRVTFFAYIPKSEVISESDEVEFPTVVEEAAPTYNERICEVK